MCLGMRGGLYEKHHLAGRHAAGPAMADAAVKSGSPPLSRATKSA